MTSLQIHPSSFPRLDGKSAVITGASSGIGLAAAHLFSSLGATVHLLDLSPPATPLPPNSHFHRCDVSSWLSLRGVFAAIPAVDIAVANAGVSEPVNSFDDAFDDAGNLLEPSYDVLGVNFRGALNTVKLAVSSMRRSGKGGSVVITTSATAYAPEHSLPVYSACKLGLVGLVRALRPVLPRHGITINAVAPAATITALLPANLAGPLVAAGLPVSSAEFVAAAVVHSATAGEEQRVDPYGKDVDGAKGEGRWNGRVVLTLGDKYTELEGPLADLRPSWFGEENARLTRMQQAATDFRDVEGFGAGEGLKEKKGGAEKVEADVVETEVVGVAPAVGA